MKQITIAEAIQRTVEHREVFHDEMLHVMRQIMRGELTPAQIAGFIVGLRVKKETVGEIAAAAQVMRELATQVEVKDDRHLVDTCGTGGDGAHTFNVSTCAAFVAAAAGASVAKHWPARCPPPRAAPRCSRRWARTSRSRPQQTGEAIDKLGIGFMFAPAHHSAMKHAAPVRKELGVRTIFNILGPLTNPAGAQEPGDGRVPPRPGRHPGARAAAPGLEARDGGARHGRPGRDLDLRRDAGRRAEERRDQRVRPASLAVRRWRSSTGARSK